MERKCMSKLLQLGVLEKSFSSLAYRDVFFP